MKAWEAGIAVVVAAGNDGPDWGTIGSPGNQSLRDYRRGLHRLMDPG